MTTILKSPIALLSLALVVPSFAFGQTRTTIFEQLDMHLVSDVDYMTEEKSCALFIDQGPIYINLYGSDSLTITAKKDTRITLNFAPDANHLIRIGEQQPYKLIPLSRMNGLKPTNSTEAKSIIDALLSNKRVRIRHYNWPGYDKEEYELTLPNLAYVYNMAVDKCGWQDLGFSGTFGPAQLWTREYDGGSATIKVLGNRYLYLEKGQDEFGGGCHIFAAPGQKIFGMTGGKWTSGSYFIKGETLIIYDAVNEILFSEKMPTETDAPWELAKIAATKAWDAAPSGFIEVEESVWGKVMLYGFRELWEWGLENCGFPILQEIEADHMDPSPATPILQEPETSSSPLTTPVQPDIEQQIAKLAIPNITPLQSVKKSLLPVEMCTLNPKKSSFPPSPGKNQYLAMVEDRIEHEWRALTLVRNPLPLMIKFCILSTGQILHIQVVKSSGNSDYDRTVLQAVSAVSPLPRFPLGISDPFFVIQFRFTKAD